MKALIPQDKIEALAKLSARLQKNGLENPADEVVWRNTMEDYYRYYSEIEAVRSKLQDKIVKSIKANRADLSNDFIEIDSYLSLASEMYFKWAAFDVMKQEKDNIIMRLSKENLELGKKAADAIKELEQLKSNL